MSDLGWPPRLTEVAFPFFAMLRRSSRETANRRQLFLAYPSLRHYPKTTSLDVQRDPTRKQEVQRKRREKSPARKTMPAFTGLELPELINRSIKAFMELPLRIVRARTPFEVWRHQHQFVQEIISDCQSVTFRVMRASLTALPSR